MRSPSSRGPSPSSSPTRKSAFPPGFRASPRERRKKVSELSTRELRARQEQNQRVLDSPGASTSAHIERLAAEQAEITARLVETVGVDSINTRLRRATISEPRNPDNDMLVDGASMPPPEPPLARALTAKQRALANFSSNTGGSPIATLSWDEAVAIEQRAHALDQEREQRLLEKKRQRGLPSESEMLTMTRKEQEARIWAFMNHKPSESDFEDDDEDDEDEDPATWFEDDQDDGIKGQDIVQPDEEDWTDIIRVDVNPTHTYSAFYEPPETE